MSSLQLAARHHRPSVAIDYVDPPAPHIAPADGTVDMAVRTFTRCAGCPGAGEAIRPITRVLKPSGK